MKMNRTPQGIKEYTATHPKKKKRMILAVCLAIMVAFNTTYAQILPAFTLEYPNEEYQENHEHDETCYEGHSSLVCGQEENSGHEHDETCYEEHSVLVCGQEENSGHEHDETCYEEHSVLACGQEESSGHEHDETCYEEHSVLICGQEESSGHEHDETCYEEHSVLVCGQEESSGHEHNDTCYTSVQGSLICENEDSDHEHTDDCYEWKKELTCKIEEGSGAHEHSEDCYESRKEMTCKIEEGSGAHEHSEDCYESRKEMTCKIEEGSGAHEHSEDCYESRKELACKIEEGSGAHKHSEDCYESTKELTCKIEEGSGAHKHSEDCYEKQTETEDTSDTDENIESENTESKDTESEDAEFEDNTYKYEDSSVSITVNFPEDNSLPKDAVFRVNRITADNTADELYKKLCDGAIMEASRKEKRPVELALYSIGFSASDGTELSVPDTAKVSMKFEDDVFHPADISDVIVLHYEDKDTPVVLEDVSYRLDEEKALSEVSFNTPGFSDFGVMTVNDGVSVPLRAPIKDTVIDSGTFGENGSLTWEVTEDDTGVCTLTISGEGDMPDFGKALDQPWTSYTTNIKKIVVEDGVTKIGSRAFQNVAADEVSIGSGVTSIGELAFGYMYFLKEITIPGTVKDLKNAFSYSSNLEKVILEEGIESIDLSAFSGVAIGKAGNTIHIPASVSKITSAWANTAGYTVATGNSNYEADQYGALYTKADAENHRMLVAYPTHGTSPSYTLPSDVTQMTAAFRSNQTLQELIIPDTFTGTVPTQCFRDSQLVRVELGKNVKLTDTTYLFNSCNYLEEVILPDTVKSFDGHTFYMCSSLTSVTVGTNVTKITAETMDGCVSLENFYYNAEKCANIGSNFTSGLPLYDLTIGKDVDVLPGTTKVGSVTYPGFSVIVDHAQSITFEGENYITVAEGALSTAPSSLNTLVGTIYVDANGIIYQYDAAAGTATLAYCPNGLANVSVPASIKAENGTECTVTAIGKYAFTDNTSLEKITFENASAITEIGERAFNGCYKLTVVSDGKTEATTVSGAKALFKNAAIGRKAFDDTGLTDDDEGDGLGDITGQNMDGSKDLSTGELSITVKSSGETMKWVDKDSAVSGVGGYQLLTGDTMTVTVSVTNNSASDTTRYRVYFELTEQDGTLSFIPGNTYEVDGHEVTCYATEDSSIVYIEFDSVIGDTLSIPVTASYPSPSSAGGGLRIWGFEDNNNSLPEGMVIAPDNSADTIQAFWMTRPDPFTLGKTHNGQTKVALTGDGNEGAILAANLTWKITLSRNTDESSDYGKDYVTQVDYTDVMTLPRGVSWSEDVLTAVRNKNVHHSGSSLYAGDTLIATFKPGANTLVSNLAAKLDGNGSLVITYTVRKTVSNQEMPDNNITATIYSDALTVDLDEFNGTTDDGATDNNTTDNHKVTNRISANLRYSYSERQTKEAEAEKTIDNKDGNIVLAKTTTPITYFGEDMTYKLTVSNEGTAPYPKDSNDKLRLEDSMAKYTYIKPENIDKMLGEAKKNNYSDLSITITGAVLAGQEAVTGYDGTNGAAYTNSENSDLATINDSTLTITLNENHQVAVKVEGGGTYTAATAEEALRAAGYAVHSSDQYTVTWAQTSVKGGETRTFAIYATAMDTFQMQQKDTPNEYPSESTVTLTNIANVITTDADGEDKTVVKRNVSNTVKREIWLGKSVSRNGEKQGTSFSASNGDLLEYALVIRHHGLGEYTDLPLVDDLCGAQALLVPKDKNPGLAGKELKTYTNEETGAEYYVLSVGSYTDVVVGVDDAGKEYTAASIIVENSGAQKDPTLDNAYTGLHTRIKWYYPTLEGGNYVNTVTYQTIVDTELVDTNYYDIGNVVWLNDRTGGRLYATLWGGGTLVDFDKDIVGKKGTVPDNDELIEDKYSLIEEGDTVTYRLKLYNKGDYEYMLPGSALADALPNTGDTFTWEKDTNVTMTVVAEDGVTLTGIESNWKISDNWSSAAVAEGQQYIVWDSDTSIHFTGRQTVYLYVTLTFPKNTENTAVWSNYCARIHGGVVENTLYVYRYPANVTHNLKEPGEAKLQKGVYGTYYYNDMQNRFYESPSRTNYSNKDNQGRAVLYYVALYNDGNRRLYLDDLCDVLPSGFTFKTLVASGYTSGSNVNLVSTLTTASTGWADLPTDAILKSAQIAAAVQGDGTLKFSVTSGTGTNAVGYDVEQRRCYLDTNEALVFGYFCDIDEAAKTEDAARNIVGMAYVDNLGGGVEVANVDINGKITDTYTTANDGHCNAIDSSEAAKLGLSGWNGQWLVSDVTVSRGNIVPGVLKAVESYVDGNGVTQPYSGSVLPTYPVNWRTRLTNSGQYSITDYTITDIMPAPYVFEGAVKLEIYENLTAAPTTVNLFTIGTRNGNDISVTYNSSNGNPTAGTLVLGKELPMNARINNQNIPFTVKLEKNVDGNEVLTIALNDRRFSIPAGGEADLCYTSRNPTNNYNNKSYLNQVVLTPNQQSFDHAGNGSLVRDENNQPVSVQTNAPVTVSFGYTTSSNKTVTETRAGENTENTASADTPNHNHIVLEGVDAIFRYALSVTNKSDVNMTKLVLIDNLPEVGDTTAFDTNVGRGSAFKVALANNPNFTVTVTDKDGKKTILSPDQYTVNYTTATEFSDDDWAGTSTSGWNADPSGARSFRIVIKDETAELIPGGTTVEVSFDAKIDPQTGDGAPKPGDIAWNSFGYQYAVSAAATELSALSLPVGIQVPEIPTLQKKLAAQEGKPVTLGADETFTFYLYTGGHQNLTYSTEEELEAALKTLADKEDAFAYKKFTVTVEKGASESQLLYLTGDDWAFTEGGTYTILEAPLSGRFTSVNWNNMPTEDRTFIYHKDTPITLTCTNMGSFAELPMTGGAGTILYTIGGLLLMAAALFLLYKNKKRRKEDFASS